MPTFQSWIRLSSHDESPMISLACDICSHLGLQKVSPVMIESVMMARYSCHGIMSVQVCLGNRTSYQSNTMKTKTKKHAQIAPRAGSARRLRQTHEESSLFPSKCQVMSLETRANATVGSIRWKNLAQNLLLQRPGAEALAESKHTLYENPYFDESHGKAVTSIFVIGV